MAFIFAPSAPPCSFSFSDEDERGSAVLSQIRRPTTRHTMPDSVSTEHIVVGSARTRARQFKCLNVAAVNLYVDLWTGVTQLWAGPPPPHCFYRLSQQERNIIFAYAGRVLNLSEQQNTTSGEYACHKTTESAWIAYGHCFWGTV